MNERINLQALAEALQQVPGFEAVEKADLEKLRDKGLAHDHVRIKGNRIDGRRPLVRVPRQSQFGLKALDNLTYQAACFERASAGGHVPRLHGRIEPNADLPMGALIVDEIEGGPVDLHRDLAGMSECQASVHRLPVPGDKDRAPLANHLDPVAGTLAFIEEQAPFIAPSGADPDAQRMITEELNWARGFAANLPSTDQPVTLTLTDTHPGNYLIEADGSVFFVDLEKALYGSPGVDLAHASLHTSTTWDIDANAELSRDEVRGFYSSYLGAISEDLAARLRPWLMPMRRLTWLRSTTWSCKWRVQSQKERLEAKNTAEQTEDWSTDDIDARLIAHVAGRVANFVNPETIEIVRSEWTGADQLGLEDI